MAQKGIFVTGIGTEVGKTVVSAVLTRALDADYWKPVQSGDLDHSDSDKVSAWTASAGSEVHPEAYRLQTPMSPHAAAEIDGLRIDLSQIRLPETNNTLVVEGAGGLWVPLNERHSMLDLIEHLGLPVVLVSRHYLGSINHTLLSLEALKSRNIPLAALIFNGAAHPTTESAIEQFSGQKALFRLDEWPEVTPRRVAAAAEEFKPLLRSFSKTDLCH